jgi:putative transposase
VTFRLADSLPKAVVEAMAMRDDAVLQIDRELDSGRGACWLGDAEIAELVEAALLHFDGDRYRLLAWCLMPNHVHVVIDIQAGASLTTIVGSWKSFSARRANERLGRTGAFWDPDYFDRYMRDEGHLARTIDYVEQNPVKVGLVEASGDWPWSSARFRT